MASTSVASRWFGTTLPSWSNQNADTAVSTAPLPGMPSAITSPKHAAFTSKDPSDRAAYDAHWERIRAADDIVIRTALVEGAVAYALGRVMGGSWAPFRHTGVRAALAIAGARAMPWLVPPLAVASALS